MLYHRHDSISIFCVPVFVHFSAVTSPNCTALCVCAYMRACVSVCVGVGVGVGVWMRVGVRVRVPCLQGELGGSA